MSISYTSLIETSQGDINNLQQLIAPSPSLLEIDIEAKIMYTSSIGTLSVLTSSLQENIELQNGGGNISFPTPLSFQHDTSAINTSGSMYFIEYEIKNFDNITSITPNIFEISELSTSQLEITASENNPDEGNFNVSGSIDIWKSNINDINLLGNPILSLPFEIEEPYTSSTPINISDSININQEIHSYKAGDFFRIGVNVNKSKSSRFEINNYSISLNATNTRLAPEEPTDPNENFNININPIGFREPNIINTITQDYFGPGIIPFSRAVNCQPLLNNFIDNRLNTNLMLVNFTSRSGSLTPSNFESLIDFTAERASIPDSNYSTDRITTPRYQGVKTTSHELNRWTPKDIDTFGKLPVIELRDVNFGYFNKIEDAYPNIHNKTQLNLLYLIDGEGNALPPSLEGIGLSTLRSTFKENKLAQLSIEDGVEELKELNELYSLFTVGEYVTPIMYSQTSSNGYSSFIPVKTESGVDLPVSNISFDVLDFVASGSGGNINESTSFTNIPLTPPNSAIPDLGLSSGQTNPYSSNGGTIDFEVDNIGNGVFTSQDYLISLETSFFTSYLFDSKGRRRVGKARRRFPSLVTIILSLLNDNTNNIPFKLKDIKLKVYKKLGNIIEVGSVISTNQNVVDFESINPQTRMNSQNQLEFTIDGNAVFELLRNKNIYRGDIDKGDDVILGYEWIIEADSHEYQPRKNDEVKWVISGKIDQGERRVAGQSVFYPTGANFPELPTKITMQGSQTLNINTNPDDIPYWEYSGSAFNIIQLQPDRLNQYYGGEYKQLDLEYTPGPSKLFPGGTEPTGTRFDTIKLPLKFQEGDEIRFMNNENYTYQIKRVTPPQSSNSGKLELTLESEVPNSIDMDFFVIRRYVSNANKILVDVPFPYSNPPVSGNTSGIIFPEFPANGLKENASSIIENLNDKGIIK